MADDQKPAAAEWPAQFDLARPVEVFGETYASLTLREPTAADLVRFGVFDDQVNGNQALDLIAHLSGLTPKSVRELPGADMLRLSRRVMSFFLQAAQ